MQGNPYSALVGKLRADAAARLPAGYRIGTVISADPLKIKVAGLIQEKEDLQKNSDLPALAAGDRCLLIPMEEEQQYLIVCKAVSV